jgi:hypothetical protein
MAETFAEREKKAPALLPAIERKQEPHSALEALYNSAANLRIHSEGTYGNVAQAGMATRIAANAQAVLPEGSAPLHARLSRALDSLKV